MTQAPETTRPAGPPPGVAAGGPPPGVGAGGPPDLKAIAQRYIEGHQTGVEGREDEYARAVIMVTNTIKDQVPYKHEVNDALVKATLTAIQFAKNQGILDAYIAHDIATMAPVNKRMGQLVAATGEREVALEGLAGYSPCHYHLYLETWKEPGKRSWRSPFTTVLKASTAIGQFDLTEEELHNTWLAPRMHGFAADMGVKIGVSEWTGDGIESIWLED